MNDFMDNTMPEHIKHMQVQNRWNYKYIQTTLMITTSANVDQISKLFLWEINNKIIGVSIPPHLTTLQKQRFKISTELLLLSQLVLHDSIMWKLQLLN